MVGIGTFYFGPTSPPIEDHFDVSFELEHSLESKNKKDAAAVALRSLPPLRSSALDCWEPRWPDGSPPDSPGTRRQRRYVVLSRAPLAVPMAGGVFCVLSMFDSSNVKILVAKGAGCRSGGCVRKAVERTSGDLPFVSDSRLRIERSVPSSKAMSQHCLITSPSRPSLRLFRSRPHPLMPPRLQFAQGGSCLRDIGPAEILAGE